MPTEVVTEVLTIDGSHLHKMVVRAEARIRHQRGAVDALNIFPIPDGDTGHNMWHTMSAVLAGLGGRSRDHLGMAARAAAQGALRGARGNSGVILSQFFRGLADAFRDISRTGASGLAAGLVTASDTAYRMVMRPVEGTILTVIRAGAEGAREAVGRGERCCHATIAAAVGAARLALDDTPNLLPVLQRAQVVDAGGRGFVHILEGFERALHPTGGGESPSPSLRPRGGAKASAPTAASGDQGGGGPVPHAAAGAAVPPSYLYDVEVTVQNSGAGANAPGGVDGLRARLSSLGDSLIVGGYGDATKVHVHTHRPAAVLEICMEFGELIHVEVNNLRRQVEARRAKTRDRGAADG